MKILYWVGHIGNMFGAYHKYILCLANVCKNHGIELIVLHEGPNDVLAYRNRLKELGAEYVEIQHTIKEPIRAIISAIHVIKKYRPDIVHYNFINPLIIPLAKLMRVPLTYRTCHNGIQKVTMKGRLSRIINNAFVDRFFAISKRVWNDEIRSGVRKDKIYINYLGLSFEYYSKENIPFIENPLPFGWNDTHTKKIITVGRFYSEKGMKFVTTVAIDVLKEHLKVIWWMVGGFGPDYSACLEMVKKNELEDRILFLQVRNDVPALLQQSYLQVISPVFEGLGLNVLEASMLSIPTIGTNIPGLDETVNNFKTGFLIEPGSVDSMISAVNLCLDNQCLRDRMGKNAKKYVAGRYNSVKWIDELMNYYISDYSEKLNRNI